MYRENLKKIRQYKGLSVAKFAQQLDIPQSTLTGYERGERTPSYNLFAQLYKKAHVNMNWFFSGRGEMFLDDSDNTDDFEDRVKQVLIKYKLIP